MNGIGAEVIAHKIGHRFGQEAPILADVDLRIPAGSFVSLIGQSGVGKSTLLRVLAGLLEPTRGQVIIDGHPLSEAHRPIGIVFQQDNLMPWRTAYDNVRLPMEIMGNGGESARADIMAMLNLVGLSGHEGSFPAQLSGGMAQRVSLARALIHKPDILLLDEPFGALDALTRDKMAVELLRIWRDRPVTVFMITHSIREAVLLSDEVVIMAGHPGRIIERLPIELPRPRDLLVEEQPEFASYVRYLRNAI